MKETVIVPVILCGGSGTRLWPASRENRPKQFLCLMDDFSLLQNTMKRALRVAGARAEHIVTVTLDALSAQVREHLAEIDPAATAHILSEPSARNTAAAVALAAAYVREQFGENSVMWVLPADHHIGDENDLRIAFQHALKAVQDDYLVTFGIRPTRPDTGYGYIQLGAALAGGPVCKAAQFVEKPSREIAQSYLDAGDYLWNSGMFLFRTDAVIAQYDAHAAAILSDAARALAAAAQPGLPDMAIYDTITKTPFDKAIMEKAGNVAIVPCDPDWSDIGSWESLWEIRKKDMHGNVVEGRAACYETKNCFVQAQDRLIACAGLEDIVVIESDNALLIADRRNADAMRVLVGGLKKSGYEDAMKGLAPAQPWSMTKTLSDPAGYHAREINLAVQETLASPQHDYQSMFLTVAEGRALVAWGQEEKILGAQESLFIPAGLDYSIANIGEGSLKIVEVAQGASGRINIAASASRKAAA